MAVQPKALLLPRSARLVLLIAVLLVSACKTLPVDDTVVIPVAERQLLLREFNLWKAVGRISISSVQQALSGGIDWEQRNADFRVGLTSPLGQALVLEQQGEQGTLQRQGKPLVRGRSAEALVLAELNVRVPLTQLAYWLRGLPGNQGEPAYDKYGRLKQLKYRDPDNIVWRAEIRRYQPVDDLDLPALVVVRGGGYDIRLTVREWQALAETATRPETAPTPAAIPAPTTTPAKNPGNRLSIPGVSS